MPKYEVVIFWSRADNVFVAFAPELAGCMAHGETREEALQNVQEAMRHWIDVARETGKPVPRPRGRAFGVLARRRRQDREPGDGGMKGATNIRNRLAAMAGGDFPTQAAELLAEMGYHSTRTLPRQSGDVADFLAHFPAANPDTPVRTGVPPTRQIGAPSVPADRYRNRDRGAGNAVRCRSLRTQQRAEFSVHRRGT